MSVYVTVRPSVRLSVLSIDSSSDVQLVSCSPGAGDTIDQHMLPAAELIAAGGQRNAMTEKNGSMFVR